MKKVWLFALPGIIIGGAGIAFGIYASSNPQGALEVMKQIDRVTF